MALAAISFCLCSVSYLAHLIYICQHHDRVRLLLPDHGTELFDVSVVWSCSWRKQHHPNSNMKYNICVIFKPSLCESCLCCPAHYCKMAFTLQIVSLIRNTAMYVTLAGDVSILLILVSLQRKITYSLNISE